MSKPIGRRAAAVRERERRHFRRRVWGVARRVGMVFAVAALAALLVYAYRASSAKPGASPDMLSKPAPDFTLSTSDGREVKLADFQGKKNVLLFFNEGVGCDPCWQQTAALQQDLDTFAAMDTEVYAVMVDAPGLIKQEAPRWRLKSLPILVDESRRVSRSYDALGGMHPDKPDHKFVLIGKNGLILWAADYPSMWVDEEVVVRQVRSLVQPQPQSTTP